MTPSPTNTLHPKPFAFSSSVRDSKNHGNGFRLPLLPTLRTLAIFSCAFLAISATTFAKQKPKAAATANFQKITEISAVSITVSIGTSGDTHETYSITDQTKVTMDGAPANARDLRAGMLASIETSADKKTALTITAKDPPAHPGRHRVG